ncbi:TolC family protein [Pseudobdellovibrio exovorus]|uniref:FusA/NodT family protein n=1 Tax=Pseudobdellovibrio exovorus JSS TaxID=1184267 RepID=M4VAB8_9BACT|nr:TolC family protein [Pseudobdellovibrio exovorus]AGH96352.1 FusA/NodT family protein [Pseudobdellovibrio exovorus JSS]
MRILVSALTVLIATMTLEARTLNWSDAIQMAKQNSLEYQSALKNYESVKEAQTAGMSGFLPRVSASMGASHGQVIGSPSTHGYSAQLSVSQNLFAGFADINSYYLSNTKTQQAKASLDSTLSRLSSELKQAYAEVYYMQDFKRLTSDILRRRKENYENVKLQYNMGRENKGSLLLSESYVEMASYDVMSAENSSDLALDNLKRILGLPTSEEITVDSNVPRGNEDIKSVDFEQIANRHPDVLTAQYDETMSLHSLKITRADFLPKLDLSGSYGYSDNRFFPEKDSWSVGLTLSIPLFDGLRTYSSYRSSSSTYESNRLSARNVFLKVSSEIKKSYYDYMQALQKEKIDRNFDKAAIMRAEVARNKYKNGFINFEEWDIVETDLINRQKENLSSERNRIIKQAQWEQAQGIGVLHE